MQKLHRDLQTTFIYVTHDQVAAMTMGDRIAIMNAGILQQVGTPGEIYDHPANLFVAGFIGTPTMNFVPATVTNGSAKASGFELRLPKAMAAPKATLAFRPAALTDRVAYGGPSLESKIDVAEAPDAKAADFHPGFLPVNRRMRERWTRIYQAMVEGDELPPIDVYKVADYYYVIDGHHRVSVARNLGRPTLNARVINVRTRAPLGPDVDPETLLKAAEYAAFLDITQLHRTRPQARLECSRLCRYDEIMQHISGHRYF